VWAAQVKGTRKAGVREELIDLIRVKGDPAPLREDERDVMNFARQLIRNHKIDQVTFDALQKRHGTPWLAELTAATGYFGFLCSVVNTVEVAVPEGGDKLPRQLDVSGLEPGRILQRGCGRGQCIIVLAPRGSSCLYAKRPLAPARENRGSA
jgi:hypothetical protein